MGRLDEFHAAMRLSLRSQTVTLTSGHLRAMTDMVGPPTYPAPRQQILTGIGYSSTAWLGETVDEDMVHTE